MHIAEVVTIAKSLPLLRLNTYKSLILSYSADYRRIFRKKSLCWGKIIEIQLNRDFVSIFEPKVFLFSSILPTASWAGSRHGIASSPG